MKIFILIVAIIIAAYFVYKLINFYLDPHRRPTKREREEDQQFELEKLHFTLDYQEKLKQKRLQQAADEMLRAIEKRDHDA